MIWARLMRSTTAFNASFFNAQRILQQYVVMACGERPASALVRDVCRPVAHHFTSRIPIK
jgi:hypothetical protein